MKRRTVRLSAAVAAVGVGMLLAFATGLALGGRMATRAPGEPSLAAASSSPSGLSHVSPSPSAPVMPAIADCPAGNGVATADRLTQALRVAQPGTVIVMSDATYSGHFVAGVSGTQQQPITLCGGRGAVLYGGSIKSGYTFHVSGADWWRLIGFTVEGGQKGVVTDHAHHVLIQNLSVHDIGDEAIHLRESSTDNTVDGNTIRHTGLNNPKFGEGIYVGTANSNWCKYTNCNPDNSDRNVISNNDISNTTAENIDIKEGTTGGLIENNRLSGQGMISSAASAWVNVKGNQWTVIGNTGQSSIKDGFQVHVVYSGWGEGNIFHSNHAEVDGPGYGYYVQSSKLATVLTCDNTAAAARSGLSNIPCQG